MKGAGKGQINGWYGYQNDDWDVSEELSPDPFSEEEHSKIHSKRFQSPHINNYKKNADISRNQEYPEDN